MAQLLRTKDVPGLRKSHLLDMARYWEFGSDIWHKKGDAPRRQKNPFQFGVARRLKGNRGVLFYESFNGGQIACIGNKSTDAVMLLKQRYGFPPSPALLACADSCAKMKLVRLSAVQIHVLQHQHCSLRVFTTRQIVQYARPLRRSKRLVLA